ncbi:MAG: phage tail tape measure protein [Synergistaceae bacterium]|nr:phage tail tape measure protein [Synergistaceae bacterium]
MADVEGVHLKITGDSRDLVDEVEKAKHAIEGIKDTHAKIDIEVDGKKAVEEASRAVETAKNISGVNIEITGDNSKAEAALKETATDLKELEGQNAEVTVSANVEELKNIAKEIDGQTANVEVQTNGVDTIKELSALIENIPNANIQISADTGETLDDINALLNQASQDINAYLNFEINTEELTQKMNDVTATLSSPDIIVGVQAEEALQKIHEVQEMLSSVDGKSTVANIGADAVSGLQEVQKFLDSIEGIHDVDTKITATVEVNDFNQLLNQASQSINAYVNFEINTDNFNQKIAEVEAALTEKLSNPDINIRTHAEEALAKINEVHSLLGNTESVINVDAKTGEAASKVQELQSLATSLENIKIDFKVNANIADAKASLNELVSTAENMPDASINVDVQYAQALNELKEAAQNINLEINTEQFNEVLRDLSEKLSNPSIKINAQAEEATHKIHEIQDMLATVDGKTTVSKVSADVVSGIQDLQKFLDSLDNVHDVNSKITIDGTEAKEEINDVANASESLNNRTVQVDAETENAKQNLEDLASNMDNLPDAEVEVHINGVDEQVERAIEQLNSIKPHFDVQLEMALQQLNRLSNQPLILNMDTVHAMRSVDELESRIQSLNGTRIDVFLNDNNFGSYEKNIRQMLEAGEIIGQNFSSALMNKISVASVALDRVGQSVERSFGAVFKTITAGVMSVVGSLGMLAKRSMAVGGGFEAQMTSVKVISGATADEFAQLNAKAREMGATLPITAAQAAQAMTIMAQRGTSVRDILASVDEIVSLTIAQGIDLATAADLVGSTMKNFGLAVEDNAKVTNEFNIACNTSALDISKLVSSMRYTAPAAAAYGASLEEALAASEVLANSGLRGEMIGTGIAMVYTKLATKSRIMGVETKNLDGSFRSLSEIFVDLKNKGFGLAEATTIFGQRGAKAALNLVKNAESLERMQKNLDQVGVTQAAVQEKMKTWPNVITSFQSAMESIHITIFDQIKDKSKGVFANITELVRVFDKWVQETHIADRALNGFFKGFDLKIFSGGEFKAVLDRFNIEDFVYKIKNFGSTLKTIGEGFINLFKVLKAPLGFLITHLETFGKISFWGWIIGKGLQVPLALIQLANGFIQLHGALKLLNAINIASLSNTLLPFLTSLAAHPIMLGIGVVAAGTGIMLNNAKKSIDDAKERLQKEIEEKDNTLKADFELKIKTGYEILPTSFFNASKEAKDKATQELSKVQELFKNVVAESYNALDNEEISTERFNKIIEIKNLDKFSGVMDNTFISMIKKLAKFKEERNKLLDEIQEGFKNNIDVTKITKSASKKDKEISSLEKELKESFLERYKPLLELSQLQKNYDTELQKKIDEQVKAKVDKTTARANAHAELADKAKEIKRLQEDIDKTYPKADIKILQSIYDETKITSKDISDAVALNITDAVMGVEGAYDRLNAANKKVADFLISSGYNTKAEFEKVNEEIAKEIVKTHEKTAETSVSNLAQNAINGNTEAYNKLKPEIQKLLDNLFKDLPKEKNWEVKFRYTLQALNGNTKDYDKLPDELKNLVDLCKKADQEIQDAAGGIRQSIIKALNGDQGAYQELTLEANLNSFLEEYYNALPEIQNLTKEAFSGNIEAFNQLPDNLKEFVDFCKEADNQVQGISKRIQDALNGNKTEFALEANIQSLVDKFFQISGTLPKEVEKLTRDAMSGSQDAYNQLSPTLQEIVNLYREAGYEANLSAEKFEELVKDALMGSTEAYNKLSPAVQKSIDKMKESGEVAKRTGENLKKSIEQHNLALSLEKPKKELTEEEVIKFFDKDTLNISKSILEDFTSDIQRATKILGKENIDISVTAHMDTLKKQLKDFRKEATEKYKLPADVIDNAIFNQLKEAAKLGDKYAQTLVNQMKKSGEEIDRFMQNAKDQMTYLGKAPESFVTGLTKLTEGIQKIDPLTGKITDDFKKAYAAAKELDNLSIDNFIQKAREAVEFFGNSPEKFSQIFNKFAANIQKIDPITGRITEGFKKARAAAQELSKMTFDNLTKKVQMLQKAFEGGFISPEKFGEALKSSYDSISQQVKLQVVTELEPLKGIMKESEYYSVVASEVTDRINALGQPYFNNKWQEEVSKNHGWDTTGEGIGKYILDSLSSQKLLNPLLQINNKDFAQSTQNFTQSVQDFSTSVYEFVNGVRVPVNTQNFSQALSPTISKLEQYNSQPSMSMSGVQDFSLIVNEVKNTSNQITNVGKAISGLEASIRALQIPPVDIAPVVSEIQNVNTSVTNLDTSVKNLQIPTVDTAPLITEIQGVKTSVDSLEVQAPQLDMSSVITEIKNVSTGIGNLDNTIKSQQPTATLDSSAIIAELQAVREAISQNQSNIEVDSILTAINNVESAVARIQAGNTFDIDISQEGFTIQQKSDADLLARSTFDAFQSGLGNGVV